LAIDNAARRAEPATTLSPEIRVHRPLQNISLCLSLSLAAVAVHAQTSTPSAPTDLEVVVAASHGQADLLQELLEKGGNARAQGPHSAPAIAYAIGAKSLKTVDVLLQADPGLAKATYTDQQGVARSVLSGAIRLQQWEIAAHLLQAGADARAVDAAGGSPLLFAAAAASPEFLKSLLDRGADPNRRDIDGVSPLMVAATNGNLDAAGVLLGHGAWTYPLDASGNSALHMAKSNIKDPARAQAMVDLLIKAGAPIDGKNRPIDVDYLEAVHRGDLAAVEAALTKGADINARRAGTIDNTLGSSVALAVPYPKLLVYLLDHGADMNACNPYGFNALDVAVGREGSAESVELLVARGMDVNHVTRNGNTPLYTAVNFNKPSMVELLLRLGARATDPGPGGANLIDLSRQGNRSALIAPMLEKAGATAGTGAPIGCAVSAKPVPACAMFFFAELGNADGLKRGLADGNDLNARDGGGRSLLEIALVLPARKTNMGVAAPDDSLALATIAQKKAAARFLLEHGANVGLADTSGTTALHEVAADERLNEFLDPLVRKGAPLNGVAGANRTTPLLAAIDRGNVAAAEFLLRAGADPNIAMSRGLTPLMAAAYQKQVSVAALLIEKGAAVDAGAENGTTALKAAVFEGQPEIIAMLLKSGADPDFDAGFPPSPRSMSRSKEPVIQAMFANKTP